MRQWFYERRRINGSERNERSLELSHFFTLSTDFLTYLTLRLSNSSFLVMLLILFSPQYKISNGN